MLHPLGLRCEKNGSLLPVALLLNGDEAVLLLLLLELNLSLDMPDLGRTKMGEPGGAGEAQVVQTDEALANHAGARRRRIGGIQGEILTRIQDWILTSERRG